MLPFSRTRTVGGDMRFICPKKSITKNVLQTACTVVALKKIFGGGIFRIHPKKNTGISE